METAFLILGAVLVIGGSVATLWLEFGSSAQRRLVSPGRDILEVLMPPLLVLALLWIVIAVRDTSSG